MPDETEIEELKRKVNQLEQRTYDSRPIWIKEREEREKKFDSMINTIYDGLSYVFPFLPD